MSTKSVAREILTEGVFNGIFPGWGGPRVVALRYEDSEKVQILADSAATASQDQGKPQHRKEARLSTLLSVSIAGCDLMGSALYTAGTCAFNSGKYAPLGLFLVTLMLFFFRIVYSEVVTAIPVNGGTYNLMLNTTTKKAAGFVACLSILSYTATAILSAFDAVVYMAELWTDVDVRLMSVVILLFFGAITICGAKESSFVTCTMFLVHMFTLTLLIFWGFAYGCQDNFRLFSENLRVPVPTILDSKGTLLARHSPIAAIYFGYSSGLLGITGFETASNYVEELADTSVFVSTVNWMWVLVGLYNPLLSLMSMMVLPMDTIYDHPSDMLAVMAEEMGGYGFKVFLCVDASFILCGGVLTALVGVSGLLSRLAKDRVLPDAFSWTNRGGSYYIAISVFVVISITLFLAIYDPENPTAISNFGGVFAISFLSVLTAFGGGAVLLKLYRPKIARLVIAKWWQITFSVLAVVAGLVGNIVLTPDVFYLFLAYLAGFIGVVSYMFLRVEILSFCIWMIRKIWMNQEKRAKEAQSNEEIIQACLRQSEYSEANQIQTLAIDKKQLRAAARKSILMMQAQEALSDIEMAGKTAGAAETVEGSPIAAPKVRSLWRSNSMEEKKSEGTGGGGLFSFGSPTKRRGNSADNIDVGSSPPPSTPQKTPHTHSMSAIDLIDFVQRRISSLQLGSYAPVRYYDRSSTNSLDEMETLLQKPLVGRYLKYLMTSLDELVSVPFVYLAKNSDPISLQLAVNYIDNNELSNTIYILHFVDDRKAITAFQEYEVELLEQQQQQKVRKATTTTSDHSQEGGSSVGEGSEEKKKTAPAHGFLLNLFLKKKDPASLSSPNTINKKEGSSSSLVDGADSIEVTRDALPLEDALPALPHETQELLHNVSVLDAFYTYKKIHAVVIRGGFFSPACLDAVAHYLQLSKNNMIMGVPDNTFPFPFAKLGGIRIAIPDAEPSVRHHSSAHLRNVLETIWKQQDSHSSNSSSHPNDHPSSTSVSLKKLLEEEKAIQEKQRLLSMEPTIEYFPDI